MYYVLLKWEPTLPPSCHFFIKKKKKHFPFKNKIKQEVREIFEDFIILSWHEIGPQVSELFLFQFASSVSFSALIKSPITTLAPVIVFLKFQAQKWTTS